MTSQAKIAILNSSKFDYNLAISRYILSLYDLYKVTFTLTILCVAISKIFSCLLKQGKLFENALKSHVATRLLRKMSLYRYVER